MVEKKKIILAIDDYEPTRELIKFYLEDAGFEVVLSQNGEEAIAVAKSDQKIDLVISDINLQSEDLDGIETVKKITKLRPDLADKIIFCSGLEENKAKVPANAVFLPKSLLESPTKAKTIINKIEEKLNLW